MPSRPLHVTRFSAPSSGTTNAVSGSRWWSAIGNPKPLGRPLPSSRSQLSPRSSEPERLRLRLVPRPEVRRLLELQLALLRQAELFRALPGLAEVVRAVHGRAVDEVVRAGVERAVARVDDRVEDVPAGQKRAFDL